MNTLSAAKIVSVSQPRAEHQRTLLRASAIMIATGMFAASNLASAQEFSVEGPLASATPPATIVCNGATIDASSATISSPTNPDLNFNEIAAPPEFESNSRGNGFIRGTCIIDGAIEPVADTVFVEVAENVMVGNAGPVVGPQPSPPATPALLSILGVNVVPIADCRMPTAKNAAGLFPATGIHPGNGCPSDPAFKEFARNEFGFGVGNGGGLSAAEGYLGDDGRLYAHTIETTDGTLLNNTPRVSIQRAQCRDRGNTLEIEIRGGCILTGPAFAARLVRF